MMIRLEDVADDTASQDDDYAFVRESVSRAEIVHVLGSIDLANAGRLETALVSPTSAATPLVVDLRDCDYIGAAGFSALLRVQRQLGTRLGIVVGTGGIPALLFSMFADHGAFRTAASIEQAIAAVAPLRAQLPNF